jgi:phosphocarrier protein HPr
MQQRSVTLINKLGLHARAAAGFVKTASGFDCDVTVSCNGRKVSGKSIMNMMMLAAARGATLDITAAGPDEKAALDQLEALIMDRFGEPE